MNNLVYTSISTYLKLMQDDYFFKLLFENIFEGLYIVNSDKKVLYWNKSAEIITGYKSEDLLNNCISEKTVKYLDKNGNRLNVEDLPISKCLHTGNIVSQKCVVIHKKNVLIPVLITAIPIKDSLNGILGAAEIILDDTAHEDLEKAHERLKESSTKDPLTNLFNRSETLERINLEIEKASRYEMPICLCICDIDDFKSINDRWGNHVGDIILRSVSEILHQNLRRTDVIGRYGGEEFIILLPLIDLHRAIIAVEKLKKAVESTTIEIIEPKKIKLSFGLTQIVSNDSLEDFIDRAESALYKAKKLGKDRIEIFK